MIQWVLSKVGSEVRPPNSRHAFSKNQILKFIHTSPQCRRAQAEWNRSSGRRLAKYGIAIQNRPLAIGRFQRTFGVPVQDRSADIPIDDHHST